MSSYWSKRRKLKRTIEDQLDKIRADNVVDLSNVAKNTFLETEINANVADQINTKNQFPVDIPCTTSQQSSFSYWMNEENNSFTNYDDLEFNCNSSTDEKATQQLDFKQLFQKTFVSPCTLWYNLTSWIQN
mgnify:CR=1 FL=1